MLPVLIGLEYHDSPSLGKTEYLFV
jgi:hypothetical protein